MIMKVRELRMGAMSMPLKSSLILTGLEPFAKGGYRYCYVHPEDADLCVKVPTRAGDARCHAEQKRDLQDTLSLRKRGSRAVFDHISAVEGVVVTDLGVGIVQRLCRDAGGRISRNLADIIRERGLTPWLIEAIDELKEWLQEQRLPTRGLTPDNLVAVRIGIEECKLVIIEGLLNRKFDWLARHCRPFSNYVIGRRLRRLDHRVAMLARTHRLIVEDC